MTSSLWNFSPTIIVCWCGLRLVFLLCTLLSILLYTVLDDGSEAELREEGKDVLRYMVDEVGVDPVARDMSGMSTIHAASMGQPTLFTWEAILLHFSVSLTHSGL